MAIDAACASSLVAVHLACESLRSGESDLAIAGGVGLILSPSIHLSFTRARMLSPRGGCFSFDTSADGYVRGEGCGAIVLKRLTDAEKEGGPIIAVIRGSAVNHCGRSSGITVPSEEAQVEVMRRALQAAGAIPEDYGYIEAHGTGTPVGDPVELSAIFRVLKDVPSETPPCAVGSVKSNIGHLEAAAGIASLIKAICVVREGQIPPNLHFNKLNERVSSVHGRLFVPTQLTQWPKGASTRTAGVSSFGFGGTNCHVVLQSYAASTRKVIGSAAGQLHLPLVLSAKTPAALTELLRQYRSYLSKKSESPLADICYTAAVGRVSFDHRAAVSAGTRDQFVEAIDSLLSQEGETANTASGDGGWSAFRSRAAQRRPNIAFIVGSNVRHADASLDWLKREPSAAEIVSLLSLDESSKSDAAEVISLRVQCALAGAWNAWGSTPGLVIAYGAGDIPAGVLGGVLTLEEGLRMVKLRREGQADEFERYVSSLPSREPSCKMIFDDGAAAPAGTKFDWISRRRSPAFGYSSQINRDSYFDDEFAFALDLCGDIQLGSFSGVPVFSGHGRWDDVRKAIAGLFCRGTDLSFLKISAAEGNRIVGLPTYCFQRKSLWLGTGSERSIGPHKPLNDISPSSLLRRATSQDGGFLWQMELSTAQVPYLGHHHVAGAVVVPGVVMLELAIGAAKNSLAGSKPTVRDISYHRALVIPERDSVSVQVVIKPLGGATGSFEVLSLASQQGAKHWMSHAVGTVAFRSN